jgi:class 3 adenylate cyclase
MGLKEDLEKETAKIFRERWSERDGEVAPEPEDFGLGNDAVKLDATVLYADMSDSTKLVDSKLSYLAAEIYKAYLTCAARIVKDNGGTITAYDGDRIMAVFLGNTKNTSAARAGLKINYAVKHIVNPANKRVYGENAYVLNHVVGIDTSNLFAARIGVRNDNDIVWVGRAANYAAKLSSLDRPGHVYITADVFEKLKDSSKYGGTPPRLMWEERTWNDMTVYRSSWTWEV